mgnify:CR=1 FL=1
MSIKKYITFINERSLTSKIDQLLEDTKRIGEEHGVEIVFSNTKTIPYPVGDFEVGGYFIDYGHPKLGIAMDRELSEWGMLLSHESSHMDQWIEDSPAWTNSFINGKESVDYIDEWCNGKEFTDEEVSDFIRRSINVELDCERRSIEKVKKYEIPVNITEEIQKANSYILFYTVLKYTRKWSLPGKSPYQVKEVWSNMSSKFDMDYFNVSDELLDIYKKYCF